MIPDDNPGQSFYMTIKDIENILIENYGADTGNRMPRAEVDQIVAHLRDGEVVVLPEARLMFVPEGGPGLFCAYLKPEGS